MNPASIVFLLAALTGPVMLGWYLVSLEMNWRRWRRQHLDVARPEPARAVRLPMRVWP